MLKSKHEQPSKVTSIDGSYQYDAATVAAAYGVGVDEYLNQTEVTPARRRISAKLGAAARMAVGPSLVAGGIVNIEAQTGVVSQSAEFMAENPGAFGMAVGSAALLGASIYGRRKAKREKAIQESQISDAYTSQNY